MTQDKKIIIGTPYIKAPENGFVSMNIPVSKNGIKEEIFFSVREEYGKYLVDDRNDATVVAFLPFAMSNGFDIISEAPVSGRLLYSVNHIIIPLLSANIEDFKRVKVIAEPTDRISSCAGATGLCWTGGVDCMYSLCQSMNSGDMRKVTHLLTADHGGIESTNHRETLLKMEERFKNGIAPEIGAESVIIFTNLQEHLNEPFLAVECFRNASVVLSLQKLWNIFYVSTTYDFNFLAYEKDNCGYYDTFLFELFSTENTAVHPVGGDVPRIKKLEALSSFEPAYRHLHPCIYASSEHNCSVCSKCIRTMTALDVLGTLEKFENVFDVKVFESKKDDYYAQILSQSKNAHYYEIISVMNEKGLKFTETAQRKARILSAAKRIVKENNEVLRKQLNIKD